MMLSIGGCWTVEKDIQTREMASSKSTRTLYCSGYNSCDGFSHETVADGKERCTTWRTRGEADMCRLPIIHMRKTCRKFFDGLKANPVLDYLCMLLHYFFFIHFSSRVCAKIVLDRLFSCAHNERNKLSD